MNEAELRPVDLPVLGALLRSPSGVDAGFLRHEFGMAPQAYHETAERLGALGCVMERAGVGSYRLIRTGLGVWADYAEHALREAGCPRRVQVFRRTGSTQNIARGHGAQPVLVLADEQTAGRGRLGRAWVAPSETAVLMSLTHALAPDGGDSPDRIALAVSVALARTLERLADRPLVHIKWPNDIIAGDRKIAGILVETAPTTDGDRVAVVGVGINVAVSPETLAAYPAAVRDRIGSTRMLGSPHDRLHVAVEAVAEIDRLLRDRHHRLLVDEWRVRNVLRDQQVRFISGGHPVTGAVLDLDPQLGLIVRTDRGAITHLPAATTTVVI